MPNNHEKNADLSPQQAQILALYRQLLVQVDTFFQNALKRNPAAFACAEGCSDCCVGDLSVGAVEAENIRSALQKSDVQAQAASNAEQDASKCVFLHADRCAIYASRPIVCRSQGLMLRYRRQDDRLPLLTTCEYNYVEVQTDESEILDADTLNLKIAALNEAFHPGSDNRTSLVALRNEKW